MTLVLNQVGGDAPVHVAHLADVDSQQLAVLMTWIQEGKLEAHNPILMACPLPPKSHQNKILKVA